MPKIKIGGKNSVFSKPLGSGSGSINQIGRNTVGAPLWDMGASYASINAGNIEQGYNSARKSYQGATDQVSNVFNPKPEVETLPAGKAGEFLKAGEAKGEQLVGADASTVGQERADIRQKFKDLMSGNSIAQQQLAQQSNAMQRQARANAAVSGGAGQMAAGQQQAMSRQAASDMANLRSQEYQQALNKLETQYRGAAGDIAKLAGQYGSIGMGNQPVPTVQGPSGVTIICTELYFQGYLTEELMAKDARYGAHIRATRPEIYMGYIYLATPVVRLMKKSKLFTKLISIPALKWANNMAGNKNLIGTTISLVGETICGFVGKLLLNNKEIRNEI